MLVLGFGDRDAAVDAAVELRLRMPSTPAGDRAAQIGAVAADDGDPESTVERALCLARAAPPGSAVVDEDLHHALGAERALRFASASLRATDPPLAAWQWAWPTVTGRTPQPPLPEGILAASRKWGMFGRAAELARIEAAWRLAGEGRRGLVLLAGEAGVGKTRLAIEAAREAHASGAAVLYGHHDPDVEIPHQGFAEVLEHLAAHAPAELLAEVRNETAVLSALAPGFAQRGDVPPSNRLGDPGATHLLLLAIATVLGTASEDRPLLIVLDDLHAADASTMLVLRHLLLGPTALRALIVATHRPADLAPEAAAILSRLSAQLSAPEIEPPRLGEAEIIGLTSQIVEPGPARPVAVGRAVSRDSGGNALYATEALRGISESAAALEDEGEELPVPRTVQEAATARVRDLGEAALRTLSLAAVAGLEFGTAMLARTLGEPVELVERQLAAAERAALLEPAPTPGRQRFAHALIQRALYERQSAIARGRSHRRLAEAIEELGVERQPHAVSELARHWLEANPPDPARALRWASRAGQVALSRFQPEAAIRLLDRALELADGLSEQDRCDLLVDLGTAQRHAGDPRFRDTLLEAGRLAATIGDRSRLVRAALANTRGFTSSVGRVDGERVWLIEQALEALEPGEDRDRAHLLATLAQELTFSPETERRTMLSDQAVRTARRTGDSTALGYALVRRFMPTWTPASLPQRLEDTTEALRAAAKGGDPLLEFHALHWRTVALVQSGEVVEARASHEREETLARRLGDATARWIASLDRGNLALIAGRLADAERIAAHSLELGNASGQPDATAFYASQIACIRWEQGRLGELSPLIEQAAAENPGIPAFRSLLALAHVESGSVGDGARVLESEAADEFARLPRDPAWLAGVITYAHVAASVDDPGIAATLYDLLEPFAGQVVYTAISVWGDVSWALGRLAAATGRSELARAHLSASSTFAERVGAPVWRARADIALARVLLDCGERERSRALLDGAAAAAAQTGATGIERHARLAADQAHRPGQHQQLTAERLVARGLTRRQADVMQLVAAGRTNAEIGAALGISDATVKRHLERTYHRLGVGSRAEAVADLLTDEKP